MVGCAVCGQSPGEHAIRLAEVRFAPGQIGREVATVPYRMTDVVLCADCWRADPLVRALLASGDLDPVTEMRGRGCRVECNGYQRGRVARWWSPFRGHRGVPEVGRCPVCWGPIEIPEAS